MWELIKANRRRAATLVAVETVILAGAGFAFGAAFYPGGGVYGLAAGLGLALVLFLTGYFAGSVDFGGGALASAGGTDIYVVKFGKNGNYLWSKRFGDDEDQEGMSVAVDDSGNVWVAGDFFGAVDFGGLGWWSVGGTDIPSRSSGSRDECRPS